MIPHAQRPCLAGLRFRAQTFALSAALLLGWLSAPDAFAHNIHPRALLIEFAETTEAFFSRNGFFLFTRVELKKHDPEMEQLLGKLWGATK